MRYAVYMLVVEDTQEADMEVMSTPSASADRLGGDMTLDEAETMTRMVQTDYGNNDMWTPNDNASGDPFLDRLIEEGQA